MASVKIPGQVGWWREDPVSGDVRREVVSTDAEGNDAASGGGSAASPASPFCAVALDNTAQQVKASAGTFYGGSAHNPSPERRYLKVFNVAAPTMGTTNAVYSFELEPGTTTPIFLPAAGVALGGTGIAVAVTAAAAKNNNTAPSSADCGVNLAYA